MSSMTCSGATKTSTEQRGGAMARVFHRFTCGYLFLWSGVRASCGAGASVRAPACHVCLARGARGVRWRCVFGVLRRLAQRAFRPSFRFRAACGRGDCFRPA